MGRKLRISPMVALLFLGMLMIDESLLCLSVFLAAGFHELGHLCAARLLRIPVRSMKLDLLGARMELGGRPSYGQEAFVAAGGPLMSLVSGALVYPWAAHPWATGPQGDGMTAAAVFCGASVLLGLLNLLPVGTLDGGRMLRCAVAGLWGDRAAVAVLRGTTAVCLGLLWMLSAYGLLRGGGFLSVFAFSLCLLGRTVCREG